MRYSRGPFKRSANYEAAGDLIRGHLIAAGGREEVSSKLGRMHEVDADLMLCKALIIAHVRARGQARWIGRVATIDPSTLVAASPKQTYRRRDEAGRLWVFEPRMGDAEEFELDEAGRVIRRRARDAAETTLVKFRCRLRLRVPGDRLGVTLRPPFDRAASGSRRRIARLR